MTSSRVFHVSPGRTFIVLLAIAVFAVDGAVGGTFSVLNYNIHRDVGSAASDFSAQPALAEVVNALNPDIWAISELGGTTPTFSRSAALDHIETFVGSRLTIFGTAPLLGVDYFVSIATYDDAYTTTAIISRFPFLETRTYSDAGGGYSALRGLNYALVDVPGSDGGVGVFTMHLKAGSDTTSAALRQSEARTNAATLTNWISLHPGRGIIVTGDWNASADADDVSNWSGHAVGDPITLRNGTTVSYDPVGTLLGTGLTDPIPRSASGDKDTLSSTNPTTRFDYIAHDGLIPIDSEIFDTRSYSSAQIAAMNAAFGTALTRNSTATASDHLPVFATFAIVPEPGTFLLLSAGMGALIAWKHLRSQRSRPAMQTYFRTR